jgi:hypothetical protein
MADFDTTPASNPAEVLIVSYYCVALPFFLFFCGYFCYQHYEKFHGTNTLFKQSGSQPRTIEIARRVGILKILMTVFSTSPYVVLVIASLDADPITCDTAWRLVGLLYVISKFLIYLFLFQRGELVSVGAAKTKFEKLVQFGTFGVPPAGIVAACIAGGTYIEGICSIIVPYWFTILVIILDAGLSCGYLAMFILKLRHLEQNFRMIASNPSKETSSSPKKEIEPSAETRGSKKAEGSTLRDDDLVEAGQGEAPKDDKTPHQLENDENGDFVELEVHPSTNGPTTTQEVLPSKRSTVTLEVRPSSNGSAIAPPAAEIGNVQTAEVPENTQGKSNEKLTKSPSSRTSQTRPTSKSSAKQKSQKAKEDMTIYRKVMRTHTRMTAITCTSTLVCMLLLVVYNATESKHLQIASGPLSGLDLFVNIAAVAYMTRGSHNDKH